MNINVIHRATFSLIYKINLPTIGIAQICSFIITQVVELNAMFFLISGILDRNNSKIYN